MEFGISDEQRQIKALTRKFVREVLQPEEEGVEAAESVSDEVDRRLKAQAQEHGLWAAFVPERWGGGGITDQLGRTLIREEIGATSYVLRGYVDSGGGDLDGATDYQREKFLLPLVRGEKRSFTGITEPNAGSDNGAMQTTAVRDGDNWVLNGTKHFISGVDRADFGTIFAVTDKTRVKKGGVSGFIVEKGTPGFTIGRRQVMMGHRGFNQYVLHFDDCVVPHANLVGGEGRGLYNFFTLITAARVKVGIEAVGSAQYAMELAIAYVKGRSTFGAALSERQGVQWMLVDASMQLQAARLLCYEAAWKADQGLDTRVEAGMAKAFGTEAASRVIDTAIQVHGGLGYTEELPLARMYRDIRATRIYEGANEIQRNIIAKSMFA